MEQVSATAGAGRSVHLLAYGATGAPDRPGTAGRWHHAPSSETWTEEAHRLLATSHSRPGVEFACAVPHPGSVVLPHGDDEGAAVSVRVLADAAYPAVPPSRPARSWPRTWSVRRWTGPGPGCLARPRRRRRGCARPRPPGVPSGRREERPVAVGDLAQGPHETVVPRQVTHMFPRREVPQPDRTVGPPCREQVPRTQEGVSKNAMSSRAAGQQRCPGAISRGLPPASIPPRRGGGRRSRRCSPRRPPGPSSVPRRR